MKKIFGGIAVVAIAALMGLNITFSSAKNNNLSDIFLTNAEALAIGESGGSCKWRTHIGEVGIWVLCDSNGVGYDCSCGDAKFYGN